MPELSQTRDLKMLKMIRAWIYETFQGLVVGWLVGHLKIILYRSEAKRLKADGQKREFDSRWVLGGCVCLIDKGGIFGAAVSSPAMARC